MSENAPLATITISDMGDGKEVIVSGDDGTGDIGTKESLLILCRAIATVITTKWDKTDWNAAIFTSTELIATFVNEIRARRDH